MRRPRKAFRKFPIQRTTALLILLTTQCSTSGDIPFDPIPEATLQLVDSKQPDCLAMVDEFCRTLYSPTMEGALFLPKAGVSVRRGQDPRDFQRAYLEFAATRVQRKDRLPKDFKARLEVSGFFQKQLSLLRTKPRASMNLEDRFQSSSLSEEVVVLPDTENYAKKKFRSNIQS
jgi:hypothetical protein